MKPRVKIGLLAGLVSAVAVCGGAIASAAGAIAAAASGGESSHASPIWAGAHNLCGVAKRAGYLPAADRCFSAVTADVDGDRRPDLVLLYGRSPSGAGASLRAKPETLKVVRASGGSVSTRLAPTLPPPGVVAAGQVNADPGAELFVYVSWISSGAEVAVYGFHAGHLVRAPVTFNFGGDSASRFGFDCVRTPRPEIIQHNYELIGPTIYGRWRLTTDTFAWSGPTLHLISSLTTIHHGWPSGGAIGVGAGCDPLPAFR